MRAEQLLEAIGLADEELLERSEASHKKYKRMQHQNLKKYLLSAAAVLLVCVIIYNIYPVLLTNTQNGLNIGENAGSTGNEGRDSMPEKEEFDDDRDNQADGGGEKEERIEEIAAIVLEVYQNSLLVEVPESADWHKDYRLLSVSTDGISIPEIFVGDTVLIQYDGNIITEEVEDSLTIGVMRHIYAISIMTKE